MHLNRNPLAKKNLPMSEEKKKKCFSLLLMSWRYDAMNFCKNNFSFADAGCLCIERKCAVILCILYFLYNSYHVAFHSLLASEMCFSSRLENCL